MPYNTFTVSIFNFIGKTYYGKDEEWFFEPKVATKVLSEWLQKAGITIHHYQCIKSMHKEGTTITEITFESGTRVRAKVYIDCSYEGDIWGRSGVDYAVGRKGDHRVQSYNFRLIVTQDKDSAIPFEKPDSYDAAEYELLARY